MRMNRPRSHSASRRPATAHTLLLALLGGLALAVVALLWAGTSGTTTVAANSTAVTWQTNDMQIPFRGMAIQLASGWKPVETYGPLIDEVAALGANTVLLSVSGYMEHARSQAIYIDTRKVPSGDDLKTLISRARERELHVILMPIVLLRNPRGNEWRGIIEPPSWDAWWQEYEEFILHFADIAREAEADALLVGSELLSTEKFEARWEKLIAAVRPRFHGGKLGYSANWDHYRPIRFWQHLDFIGLTTYNTLSDRKNPTVDEVADKWREIRATILDWQRQVGKPLVMTEVGWCSQEGAAMAPWNYYQNQTASPEGHEEQRRLYEAFLRAWADTPELLGVVWWEWSSAPGGAGDFGYTPRGKPAEDVLRSWFRAGRSPPTTRPHDSSESK